MSMRESALFSIRDDPTPKISGGEKAYTIGARDYKGALCVMTVFKTFRKKSHAKTKDDGQGWQETEVNDTLNIFDNGEARTPTLVLENHPADSRVRICEDNVFQTLSSRMGTGGG